MQPENARGNRLRAGGGPAAGLAVRGLRFRDRGPFRFLPAPGVCTGLTGPSGIGKSLLLLASGLVGLLVLGTWRLRLGLAGQLVICAVRTAAQLFLVGYALKALFAHVSLLWVGLAATVMLLAAGREVVSRQKRRDKEGWAFGVGALSMATSSFAVTILATVVIIGTDPWYHPQYLIPLLGMLLGNTMTGIALSLDRLTQTAWEQRDVIEARLALGQEWSSAISSIVKESIRSGMIPIINSMAVAGLVSLPGMMTGQIIAGSPPDEAVKYQILIMFLIAGGTGMGVLAAVGLGAWRLFDRRARFRPDRLIAS
ncbi:MAG: iron export ABC transporter permease subunit FetB [Desulfobacterales bacterium]|nr:iron export ABC transporter permease subunit FetB [Desulfobacterales bacterium]